MAFNLRNLTNLSLIDYVYDWVEEFVHTHGGSCRYIKVYV
jgi:hypothetical protein